MIESLLDGNELNQNLASTLALNMSLQEQWKRRNGFLKQGTDEYSGWTSTGTFKYFFNSVFTVMIT